MKRRPKCSWCQQRSPQRSSLLCLECNLFNHAVRCGLSSGDKPQLLALTTLGRHIPQAISEFAHGPTVVEAPHVPQR